MYLTPERFRTMGFGVDLSEVDDVALQSTLVRASAVVDSFCAVPRLPSKFDFRGGEMDGEEHTWRADMYDRPAPYRFYPWAGPVKAVSQFRIYSTPTVYVEIEPDEIFINNSAGWLEISSLKLTQFGIFGAGVTTYLIGMYNPVARVTYTYGWAFSVIDELLEPVDAGVYQAQNQWWDSTVAPEIKKNDVVISTGFTINYNEGTVIFSPTLTATDVVTASYTHKMPWEIAQATGIIAAEDFGESDLRAKGMSGVDSLTAGEITLRRSAPSGQRGGTLVAETMSARAASLLTGFVFRSAR